MDDVLRRSLELCETDLSGVMRRFCNDESLYISCLREFLEDATVDELDASIRARAWDEAFTAAHALKGLAGNMGFVPLFHAAAEMVLVIRAGRLSEIDAANRRVRSSYNDVALVIRGNLCSK